MSRSPRGARFLVLLLGIGLALGLVAGVAYAAFFSTTSDSISLGAAPDFVPPSASASVIAKQTGYLAGAVKQGGIYYVYANATDTGNPASGISTITANLSNITAGATAVPLTSAGGPFSAQGVSYTYRSGLQTAINPLAAGSQPYTLSLTDVAGNGQTQSGFSVTVDNTVPAGSDIQTANKAGGTAGQAEVGDTVTFTFSKQIDPDSILAGWTGAGTTVTVRLNNNQLGCTGSIDGLQIFDSGNTAQLPLGSVCLANNGYVSANRTFAASTMVQSGSSVVVTLGTASGATGVVSAPGTMTWTPSATPVDAAGNASSTLVTTESGPPDVEF